MHVAFLLFKPEERCSHWVCAPVEIRGSSSPVLSVKIAKRDRCETADS